MQTRVKTPAEIETMRESGQMLARVLELIKKSIQPGWSGLDVSELCKRELKGMGAKGSFLGYHGYPDVICISVNDEVVHGIPNGIAFEDGDLVSFDFGVTHKGLVTDGAISMFIGKKLANTPENKKAVQLLQATEASLDAGIEVVRAGMRVGDIGAAVQGVLDAGRYGIVRELVGHGVGHQLHEDPDIPNYGRAGTGMELKAGMTIAIEPMATLGDRRVIMDSDGWTIRTRDGSLAAHFEHTVLVTDEGHEVLTRLK